MVVIWDDEEQTLIIGPYNGEKTPKYPTKIKKSTLEDMSFERAAKFVGEIILFYMPSMKKMYSEYLDSDHEEKDS